MVVQEIARRAGVSITTVSRVLNNNPSVRPETAQHVRKILEQYPYDRNVIRRGPRPGKRIKSRLASEMKRGVVSIVALGKSHDDWFKMPIFGSIVSAITRAASEKHISVRIEEVLDPSGFTSTISSDVVDGALVFIAAGTKSSLLAELRKRLPVVRVMGDDLVSSSIDQVRPDNASIGHIAFEYLAKQGCKRLACVGTRLDHGGILLRTLSFATTAVYEGFAPPTLYTSGKHPFGPWIGVKHVQAESLEAIATAIAESPERPDGIFISQDLETIGLYPLLARHGIQVGRDVKIISCNNDESIRMLSPRPATIDLSANAIGRWSLRRLMNRITRPDDAPIQMLVKPTLVEPVGVV